MPPYLTGSDTRSRLLEAAAEVFAEKGFRHAKVQEICQRAKANVAAVNYHFGDKERLYMEVIDLVRLDPEIPDLFHANLDPEASPEERLRQFIRSFMFGLLGTGRPAWHGKLMANETTNPTPALDVMVEKVVRPLTQEVDALIATILGPAATPETVHLCTASIISQCVTYHTNREIVIRLNPGQRFDPPGIERLADFITEFSLAGLRAIARANLAKNKSHERKGR